MILVDFRNWDFGKSLGYLPSAQKELLQRDFEVLNELGDFEVLELFGVDKKPIVLSDLFFENKDNIAVSPVKNVSNFYESIDLVLETKNKEVVDYTEAADEQVYFYGASSLVVHSDSEIALCGINDFTDESLFEEYCEDFELTPFSFEISNDFLTSDIALFTGNTLLLCLDFIKDKKTRKDLFSLLKLNHLDVILVTKEQVEKGVLNMKLVENTLIITKQAEVLLTKQQKEQLLKNNTKVATLPFLEKVGVKLRDVIL